MDQLPKTRSEARLLLPARKQTIIDAHRVLGNRWAQISRHFPGRTDNEVKNFWNSCMRKKLLTQGIDPKTHRLISELEMHEHKPLTCSHEPSSGFQYSSSIPNSDLELGKAMREGITSKFAYTRDAVSGENLGLASYGLVPMNASYEQGQTLQKDVDVQLSFAKKNKRDGNLNGNSETKFHSQANDGKIEISRFEEKPHFPFDQTLSAHIEQLEIGSSSYESDHPLISPVNELEAAMRFNANLHQMNPPSLEADFKPMHLPKLVNENEFNSQQLQASNYYQYQNQNQYLISYSSSASSAYGEHRLDADLSLDSSIPIGIYFGMIP